MKVAIVGSRTWDDYRSIDEFVSQLPAGTAIVSGGANGADQLATEAAAKYGLMTIVVRPAWRTRERRPNRLAGFERNSVIVELADWVVAFWDGESHGTKDTIDKARAAGKYRYWEDGPPADDGN